MPLTTATTIYGDWILGDPTHREYWFDHIEWIETHPDDFPGSTFTEAVAEQLGDALAQDVEAFAARVENDDTEGDSHVDALFVRLLEEAAGNVDYEALAERLIREAAKAKAAHRTDGCPECGCQPGDGYTADCEACQAAAV